jgi:hypothetical protein
MAKLKLIGFLGTAPKLSPELLQDRYAQIAENANVSSGDITPYGNATPTGFFANGGNTSTATLYGLDVPPSDAGIIESLPRFLSWPKKVDVTLGSEELPGDKRIYYTGDGVPKVTDFTLATGYGDGTYARAGTSCTITIPLGHTFVQSDRIDVFFSNRTADNGEYVVGESRPDQTLLWGTLTLQWSVDLIWGATVSGRAFIITVPNSGPTSGSVRVYYAMSQFYPRASYTLGLPLPSKIPATTFTPFTPKAITNLSRDSGGIVTATCANHGIRDGTSITVSKATSITGTYVTASTGNLTATYTQASATLAMQIVVGSPHNFVSGLVLELEFGSHSDINGAYSVNVTSPTTFFISTPAAAARTGTVTIKDVPATTVTITANGHGIADGSDVILDFTSGSAPDGTYTVTNSQTNTFDITIPVPIKSSGGVRIDVRSFNAVNVTTTVLDANTFTYFSPGFTTKSALGTGLNTLVDIGGLTQARTYAYTWYTPWGEESIASEPSIERFAKEGVVFTISNLPTPSDIPAGTFVRGIRLYRTLPSLAGTDFFRLRTLWYPTDIVFVNRASNVITYTSKQPHNLNIDDRFLYLRRVSISDPTISHVIQGTVTEVVSTFIFRMSSVGANFSLEGGFILYDISEVGSVTPRYWGAPTVPSVGGSFTANYNFTDDINSTTLTDILETDDYDSPPSNLQGLVAVPNSFFCGFVGNTLYFSEPAKPHAWPLEYAITVESDIVAIAESSGAIMVFTMSYPYMVSGSDPRNTMQVSRLNAYLPCLAPGTVVSTKYGVMYISKDGIASVSGSGVGLLSLQIFDKYVSAPYSNVLSSKSANFYLDSYILSNSGDTKSFLYNYERESGGYFATFDIEFKASTLRGSKLYVVNSSNNSITEWDVPATVPNRNTYVWKSKVFVTQRPINFGVCKIEADYSDDLGITFKLFTNKSSTPIITVTVTSNKVFRLPSGYMSDTFEVEVSGKLRLRSIHLSETAIGLREI